jgi:DNA-binding NarL/FixJ family response regulator
MERATFKRMSEAGAVVPHAGVISVAVIEDQRDIRDGLAALIGGTAGFRCTGAYYSMETALREIPEAPPDIALIDIDLPGMSGIEGIRCLRAEWPQVFPLVLTVHDDDDRVLDALCAGANGYLLKNTPPVRLLDCIRDAANGGAPMSPEVARRVIDVFRQIRPPANAEYQLTPHESRILKLLVEGENYKTAAAKLDITVNTISYHVRRIYEKLQVHSRTEAVAKALRSGMFK